MYPEDNNPIPWQQRLNYKIAVDQLLNDTKNITEEANLYFNTILGKPSFKESDFEGEDVNPVVKYNLTHGVHSYKPEQIDLWENYLYNKKRWEQNEDFKKKHPFLASMNTVDEIGGSPDFRQTVESANFAPTKEDAFNIYKEAAKDKFEGVKDAFSVPILFSAPTSILGFGLSSAYAYDSAKHLISPEGIQKTIGHYKNGEYGQMVKSGLGDLLDLAIVRSPFKTINAAMKNIKALKYAEWLNSLKRRGPVRVEYQPAEWQPQPEFVNYAAPRAEIKSVFGTRPIMSDFSGVENVAAENVGYGGVRHNLGLQKLRTENRAGQLAKSYDQEVNRNHSALNWSGKNWRDLSNLERYWLKTLHGNEWKDKDIVSRLTQ